MNIFDLLTIGTLIASVTTIINIRKNAKRAHDAHRNIIDHKNAMIVKLIKESELKERKYIADIELARQKGKIDGFYEGAKQGISEELAEARARAKERSEARKRDEEERAKRDNFTSNNPRDYELHPNGERNMKYNGNPMGKGKCASAGTRGFHAGQERQDFGDHNPFERQRHFHSAYQSFEDLRRSYEEGERHREHVNPELARAMRRFGIIELTKREVKKAHRRLAKQYHPDLNSNANASEKMQEVNEVRDYLMKMCKV